MNFIFRITTTRNLFLSLSILLTSVNIAFAQNPIITENLLPGTPQATWFVNEGGPIEGFAQEFSVNKGETVHFKINIQSAGLVPYTVKIYRIGWYGGNGARLIADLGSSLVGKSQPAYNYDVTTGKADCNNWSVSASWTVPNTTATVSGVYIAKFDCPSVGGSSIQQFVVRDDAANSPVLFKTSDATWQAYNTWGGNTFYAAATPVAGFMHATKVSYQRPLYIRGDKTSFFNSEYPMIRWLERNGYNVSYATDLDMARDASVFTPSIHKTILSVGHDEYYSLEQKTKLENARANGVNIAFFSGNEVYWKTRWEDNYQTLVCYKEGAMGELVCGTKCDPVANVWTGLWRDGCSPDYAANDGCSPEGSLSGQMSWAQSTGSIKVPDTYKNLRFWKNTSIAALGAGQTKTLPYGTLGNEWDPEQYTYSYPAHRIVLSNTLDNGNIHKMALYRHSSGALVFSAGTMQWAWGLDDKHEMNTATGSALAASADMQQATANLLHDMGVDPGSIQSGLVMPTIAADVLAPTTTISTPVHNATVSGSAITVTGTSVDNGTGSIGGVEFSVDNGATWKTATGLGGWTFSFVPTAYGTTTIKVRAWDDLGNVETAGSPGSANCINISISGPLYYSVFNSTYPQVAPTIVRDPSSPVEVGMKFRSSVAGKVFGFRYYKGPGITGTHTGHLWTGGGDLLATAVFTNETPTGWQYVTLATGVSITANTTYVVSYLSPSGNYMKEDPGFITAVQNGFLRGLADGEDGGNGVYIVAGSAAFPDSPTGANYFADVLFKANDVTAPTVSSVAPLNNATNVALAINPKATFNEAINPASVTTSTVIMKGPGNVVIPATVSVSGSVITVAPTSILTVNTVYTITLKGGLTEPMIKDLAANPLAADYTWSFTTTTTQAPSVTTQPLSQPVCTGGSVSFSSAATIGTPVPAVKWQLSINGGSTWSDISGATSATYTFKTALADNNKKYRAVWTNSAGTANSNAATLTVSSVSSVLAGTVGGQQACNNSTVLPAGISYADGSCNLIASVTPSGTTAVTGMVNSCVKVESEVILYLGRPIVQRHYDITPATNAANATATVTLYFTQQEFDAYNFLRGTNPALPASGTDVAGISNLLVTQYHGTGTAPGNYSGSSVLINPLDNNITWNSAMQRWEVSFAVNGFSGFYVHTSVGNIPLPVSLVNFSGRNNGSSNVLNWSTASEQNSSHFILERSTNGVDFMSAASIAAAGNSSTGRSYVYNDNISLVSSPIYYYRLKMVDISGAVKYSTIVKIRLNSKGFMVEATPTPFVDQLKINIETETREYATIRLNDMSGRTIRKIETLLSKGNNALQMPGLDNLPGAVYLLNITTASQKQTIKLVKQ